MKKRKYVLFIWSWWFCTMCTAQFSGYNFRKLSVSDGLHDGIVRAVGQDKFGFIWIATVGALNRFDGKNIQHFTNIPGDSLSPYSSQPKALYSDSKGNFWIGYETGLLKYDFNKQQFERIPALKDVHIYYIIEGNQQDLYLITNKGLVRHTINEPSTIFFSQSNEEKYHILQNVHLHDIVKRDELLYIGSNKGLFIFSLIDHTVSFIEIPILKEIGIFRLAVDNKNNIWVGTHGETKLLKLFADLRTVETYDTFLKSDIRTHALNITDILVDTKGKVWVSTLIDGIMEYDDKSNIFIKHMYNSDIPSSPSGNYHRCLFEDRDGLIWAGGDMIGVNYFDPSANFFKLLMPFPDRLRERTRNVARGITQDKDRNIWIGSHDGVVRYNTKEKSYDIWRNDEGKKPVIYSNLVRTLLCDDDNNIWIGTGAGVNKFNYNRKKMEFIPEENLPLRFYNSINKDRSGNIWFCTNDTASLYWYDTSTKKYNNISNHPQLKKFAKTAPTSYVFEDSNQRLWISLSKKGIIRHDKNTLFTKLYASTAEADNKIIGDQVVDIKEDKKGVIWISTFNGISGIDVANNKIMSFNNKSGLVGNMVSPIAVDNDNRLWIGISGGLMMLNDMRNHFTTFNQGDGLSSVGFPEHAAVYFQNNEIAFPSNNGVVIFNPDQWKEKKSQLNFYIRNFSVFGQEYFNINESTNNPTIQLTPSQNSFSFNLVALNYTNLSQTWYAYKLEGFEKEWHYTKDPKAVFTNIPGGKYTFLYKAATVNNNWHNIPEKKIEIILATVFFRTKWFLSIIILLAGTIIYFLYKYRVNQQKQVYELKSKAQLLEKEKTAVMYENLKQHLNPHFLFNSLTSLSSLIRIDQRQAGDFLDKMSKVYRYILKNKENETVPLIEELKFVDMYNQLQKTRFGDGLHIKIDIPDEFHHRKIAPVTLQNLVENAIKHNIADEESPLIISMFIDDDYLMVQNNLQTKGYVETSNKQGQNSMISLYKYLSPRPVVISETDDLYTVQIPLI
ncbi:MAG: histidine kinase [Saprospiraceae bacterium]|nr:histidine kinase [Saprospiraceae bacterium]